MSRDETWGYSNTRNPRLRDLYRWKRPNSPPRVPATLKNDGWRSLETVPEGKYVGLYFSDNLTGGFESPGALIWQDEFWRQGDSELVFDARHAIAWRPWTKKDLKAQPQGPKGRKG